MKHNLKIVMIISVTVLLGAAGFVFDFGEGSFAISVFMGFQIVVSFGCFGQSGNSMPSAITISQPQQTVLYTPNFVFSSPFVGILPRLPTVHPIAGSGVGTLAYERPNVSGSFSWDYTESCGKGR